MAQVPASSIPSMAQKFQGLRMENTQEKALMVRIGTLIDAIVEAQRGSSNAAGGISRKANVNNLKKPKLLTGATENIFNGAQVNIDVSNSAANLSHYEAQIDSDPNFSDPTNREVFTSGTTFKGLTADTEYSIRIRPVTKDGQIGDWATLDTILTTGSTVAADIDGDSLGATVLSKSFSFDTGAQDMFCGSNGGIRTFSGVASAALCEQQIRSRRASTVIETITLPGVTPTQATVTDGTITLQRNAPIIFFNLMGPADGASFPASYTFDVQISLAGAAFASSTKDTTWVLF